MKIRILAVLFASMALVAVGATQSQNGSQGNQGSQNQASQSQTSTGSNQNMSGTVSHDRKTVMNDKNDKRYKVDNPDALAGKEDQHVALIVHFDPDSNVIHVIQVEQPPQ
jgi:Flp pilus assembly protein TadD